MSELKAPIFDIQSLSTQDGPGIRTVIFLKGCPLRCSWCSNPEGQKAEPQLRFHLERCKACFLCRNSCSRGAVTKNDRDGELRPIFNRAICNKCDERACVDNCPSGALDLVGRIMTAQEVLAVVKKDIRLYRNSGGGVTFGGGEPLLYPDFIFEVVSKLRSLMIDIAVETCGFWEWDEVANIIPLVDLFFFDLKSLDDLIHIKFTGRSNRKILENLEKIAGSCSERVVVSMPIIPGVTDSLEKVEEMGKYIRSLNLKKARLLPYHRFSLGKYGALGMDYPHQLWDKDIDAGLIEEMKTCLFSMGLNVVL